MSQDRRNRRTENGWRRVSRNERCPVCDGPDNCCVSVDGSAVWCGRIQSGSVRQNAGGQFLHRLVDNRHWPADAPPVQRNPTWPASTGRPSIPKDWGEMAKEFAEHPQAVERRQELAERLAVDRSGLDRICAGWSSHYSCWTIPERDSNGNVIGLVRRYRDGRKRQWTGGSRGLTYVDDWQIDPGPVFLVEGASDVAACLSHGLCVVGRPSNVGGVGLLIELLRGLPIERQLIVVGENDYKPHNLLKPSVRERHRPDCPACSSCWPGHFGAFRTARQLSDALQRDIDVMFPPIDRKDVRDMLGNQEGAS